MKYTKLPCAGIRVTGNDRLDFIQGQMSNDLRAHEMVSAAFLDPRGRVEHFARLYKRPQDIFIHCETGHDALIARLKQYIIFDQVALETVPVCSVHLWNPEEAQKIGWQNDGPVMQQWTWNDCTLLGARVNRTGTAGIDLHYLESVEAQLPLSEPYSLEKLDRARILSGIPDPMRDQFLGYLLPEIGLDQHDSLPSISYRKGCYVGQEIMARLEARKNVRYELRLLKGEEIPSHTQILQNERVVGNTGLSIGTAALARIKKGIGGQIHIGDSVVSIS